MKKAMMLLALGGLLANSALAENEASYNPVSGAVAIPKLEVVGDSAGVSYQVDMQQGENFNFAVTDVRVNAPSIAAAMNVQVGPRPFFLIDNMDDGELKTQLQACENKPLSKNEFSIGHRGACMQFPEHTKESYVAAARMGAGIVECDVTFTKDRELVCRHSQCDLHTTTDILTRPELAAKCSVPFDPAKPSATKCCTSDITLAEFKTLCGKMDASNSSATTVAEFLKGTASWRTDLYSTCGTVVTHKESIELFKQLGVKMTPELKTPSVTMPYEGDFTQELFAQKMIDEYKAADVPASDVFAQSFLYADILYWIKNEPDFAKQAVFLGSQDLSVDASFNVNDASTWGTPSLAQMVADGVKYIAPPMWVLLTLDANKNVVPSEYAKAAKKAGLNMITWTLERSGTLTDGGGWYYTGISDATNNSGDMLTVLDVLAQQVGIKGIFSDWAGTVTYYANCMGLK